MSMQAMTKALSIPTGHAPSKHVLLLLANYADENGECFPSIDRIATESELAARTVRKCLELLEGLGLLSRDQARKADGTMARSRFRLNLDASPREVAEPTDRRHVVPTDDHDRRHDVPTDRRHVVPSPAARGATGYIRMNPPLEPYEREAREREDLDEGKEGGRSNHEVADDSGFDDFMRRYPSGHVDNRQRALSAWSALSDGDRKRALEAVDAYRIEARRSGRTKLFAAVTYLADRVWERLAVSSASGSGAAGSGGAVVGAWSRSWWVILHRRHRRGESVRFMLDRAASGSGYMVPASELPTVDDERELVQVGIGSPQFAAWSDWLASRGVALPALEVPFVWMPADWPDGAEPDYDEAEEFDGGWRHAG